MSNMTENTVTVRIGERNVNQVEVENLLEFETQLANRIRRWSAEMTTAAGSGHPTSCMSCAEILAVLFSDALHYDLSDPDSLNNDRFILSKGHAAPALWATLAECGAFPREQLMQLRKFDSFLEGHPTPRCPWVDVATGSLGQGLSVAAGMALCANLEGRYTNRFYTLLGDGELAEGSVWEACAVASHYSLTNLVAIVDCNTLGQANGTLHGENVEAWAKQFEGFGWQTQIVDGHSIEDLEIAFENVRNEKSGPSVILAKTLKGKGIATLENAPNRHGKPLQKDELEKLRETVLFEDPLVEPLSFRDQITDFPNRVENYKNSIIHIKIPMNAIEDLEKISPRKAFGQALLAAGPLAPKLIVLDGDVSNSTYTSEFAKEFPQRFIQCFIAEQNMVGMALGFWAQKRLPCLVTFGAFLTRAHDQFRMASISGAHMIVGGSHCGVSIGEDGPSQMALEDLSLFRSLEGSCVLVPSDGISAYRLLEIAIESQGINYIRLERPDLPILYDESDDFSLGSSQTLMKSNEDQAVLFGCGITVHECLKAYYQLEDDGIPVRVIDMYSIKPIDVNTIVSNAQKIGRIVVVEDHHPQGGLGEAVFSALAGTPCKVKHLAVRGVPRSGSPSELREAFEIDHKAIAAAVHELLT